MAASQASDADFHRQVLPVSSSSGTTAYGSSCTYDIHAADVGVLSEVRLRINVSETGGAQTVTSAAGFHHLDRAEIEITPAGDLGAFRHTVWPAEMKLRQLVYVDPDQFVQRAATVPIDTDGTVNSTAIAASGTATYYVDITSIFQGNWLVGQALAPNTTIRYTIYWNVLNTNVWSGAGTPSLVSSSISVVHYTMPPAQLKAYQAAYANGFAYQVLRPLFYTTDVSYTAAVAQTVSLSAFDSREVAALDVALYVASAAEDGTAGMTHTVLTSIDVILPNGSSLYGTPLTAAQASVLTEVANVPYATGGATGAIYHLSFAQDFPSAYKDGIHSGDEHLTTNHNLSIVSSTGAPTTYRTHIVAWCYGRAFIRGGRMTLGWREVQQA